MPVPVTKNSVLAYDGNYRYRYVGTETDPWQTGREVVSSTSEMMSISHKRPYASGGDNGGPFWLNKTEHRIRKYSVKTPLFEGDVRAGALATAVPDVPVEMLSNNQLDALGASMMSRVLPTNPSFSLATTLGELKEGVPSVVGSTILKDRARDLRSIGPEYLNIEFGWKPLISDLQKFARNVKDSQRIVDNYVRNSNKKIRRRTASNSDPVTTVVRSGGFLSPTVRSIGCNTSYSRVVKDESWFSGCFRYHVPMGDDGYSKLVRYEAYANQILGLRLTPAVVWELAPWSWAADWFTNIGDVMTNISALGSDGLVMQYGYAMRSFENYEEWNQVPTSGAYWERYPRDVTRSKLRAVRQRRPANPFGFGIDDTTLSQSRLAILAALGLSAGRR